jgi:hypothetical protein
LADSTPQSKEDPDEGSRRQLPPSTWHRPVAPWHPRQDRRREARYVYLHCVIDDRSRYAYVEQHRDQGGGTAAAVLGRAIEHFASLGKVERFIQTLKREWTYAHS